MKKNILLLTTIYPAPDLNLLNNTNVCHYFAKEWVQMGYNVRIIFNYPIYSPIFHLIAKIIEKKLASKGSAYITTRRITKDLKYNLDGVEIFRLPLYKFMPRIAVKQKIMNQQIIKIEELNAKDNFRPDIVVAHFFYPHLEMVNKLSKVYNAKSCIIVHDQGINLKKIYKNRLQPLLDSINIWGYRSLPLKINFEKKYNIKAPTFQCYSGIPENYLINNSNVKIISLPIKRFVYVGSFIKRKNPHKLAEALCNLPYDDWHIDYVGQGEYEKATRKILAKNNKLNNATFWGQIDRVKVQEIISHADCFIMISSNESFGLVYLEAMAKGLLTIASKDEGMDGIIIDNMNGFLCKAGDAQALENIILKMNKLSQEKLQNISSNALTTANNLTDKNVAKSYIQAIEKL